MYIHLRHIEVEAEVPKANGSKSRRIKPPKTTGGKRGENIARFDL